jgi:ribonucleoside-diphosphate reductase alpha chain
MSYWITPDTRTFMSRGYLPEGQSVEDRIKVIAKKSEELLQGKWEGFAEKLEEYLLKGWLSLSSPIWSNFGTDRGLPISCNGSYVGDSVLSILSKQAEIGMMSKYGSGTSLFMGALRKRGSEISTGGVADGPVHYVSLYETTVSTISQNNVRRGSCVVYLPVTHPDIKEFLELKEEGSSGQHISIGVTIPDQWMEDLIAGDANNRKIWSRIIKKRFETGYPYIIFSDTANRDKPIWWQNARDIIWASNLCTEIFQPSNEVESFVCCLLSLNALHYDEWKNTDLVRVATFFLDTVITEYINKLEHIPFMEAARNAAIRNRAIGIGVLGWHSYLQSKMIPYRSSEAKHLNVEMHKLIDELSWNASAEMALMFGEPEALKGYGQRNATRMANAPTTSSSFILGAVSPSTEPENSNYYIKDLAKGKFTYKNPYLKKLLKEKGIDTPEVWKEILLNGGSVQFMSQLTDHEKSVFETFGEIPQFEVISQAAMRQPYIDQGQSLNLMIHPNANPKDVSDLLIEGWKLGIKSFYYQRSTNPAQEYARSLLACVSCEA